MSLPYDILIATADALEASAETITNLEKERDKWRVLANEKTASEKPSIDWLQAAPLVRIFMEQGLDRQEARERVYSLVSEPSELLKVATQLAAEISCSRSFDGGRPLEVEVVHESEQINDPYLIGARQAAKRLEQLQK
jgi:hypothetical protein